MVVGGDQASGCLKLLFVLKIRQSREGRELGNVSGYVDQSTKAIARSSGDGGVHIARVVCGGDD